MSLSDLIRHVCRLDMATECFGDGSKIRPSGQTSRERQLAGSQIRSEFMSTATTVIVAICALTNQRG
jgi:hypothetical protein